MAVLCCARVRRGDWTEVIDVANGCFWGGMGHHQKGADSLRLKTALDEDEDVLLAVQWKCFCDTGCCQM